jgi:hypothetical protein
MVMDRNGARETLQRYFAGFGIAEPAELERLTGCVLAEIGSADAESALLHAEALVGSWFAQTIGLSRDFAALAPTMAMAAFQRRRFPTGTLLCLAPLAAETVAALTAAVPVVRPASSGLPMLPQDLALPSFAALARRLLPRGGAADAEQVSTAH